MEVWNKGVEIILSVAQHNVHRNLLYKIDQSKALGMVAWMAPGIGARSGPIKGGSLSTKYKDDTGLVQHNTRYKMDFICNRAMLIAGNPNVQTGDY